ncbi:MAG: T9SS type A sorting domain-containing protein [Bacteroidota bacterium]
MKAMKTFVPFKQNILKVVLLLSLTAYSVLTQAQSSSELKFENNSLYSGSAGADNAVYRFPDVNSTMDAMVKITGRSSASVSLSNIDVTSTGFSKAFQPQLNRGSVSSPSTWWMEFEIRFVNKGTNVNANIAEAFATAIDIDGNNNTLQEWDAFYGSSSYTVETPTQLTVTSVIGTIGQSWLTGFQFLGALTDYPGIDTSATELMTTHRYVNTNSITVRFGGTTTGSASSTNRMYSVWFKNFTYTVPLTLPVKLASFTATLNNNSRVDLKWTTASEINVSHFVVEKSFDGANFSDAGLVFAYGNATDNTNYSFADNLGITSATVIYYRLRSVDMDGKAEFSETRMIRISKGKESTISILAFPNPAINELRITIPATWQNKAVAYQVYSFSGQLVNSKQAGSSSQTETINVCKLAPGMYIVKATCETETAQQRIVKQ